MSVPNYLDPKNKIVKAVAPLKERAMLNTRARCHQEIELLKTELAKVDFEVDRYAPEPRPYSNKDHPMRGTPHYAMMFEKRRKVYQNFTARKRDYQYDDKRPVIVDFDPEKAGKYFENEVARAVASYNAWVCKLIGKIGDVSQAKLRNPNADLWGFSFLEVVSVTRGAEVWKTQEIVNCSKLGRYFNQWPTRKVKG